MDALLCETVCSITKRFNRGGREKRGKPISEEKRRAPLRRIVRVLRDRASLFDSDRVELECVHVVEAFG